MTPAKTVYVLLLATVLGLAVVWQSADLRRTGYRLERVQARIAEQQADKAVHAAHLAKLKSPRRVLGLVGWLGLDLQQSPLAGPDRAPLAQAGPGAEPEPEQRQADGPDVSVAALTRY